MIFMYVIVKMWLLFFSILLSAVSTKLTGKTETMTAVAELAPGTGVNVTLSGTRIDGEMSYWATLKTIFKDGSSSTRLLEGHRRIKDIQDIRLEHSRIYFLYNDSIVPDPTTTTTTTTTTSSPSPLNHLLDGSEEDEEDEEGELQRENALPVEGRNDFLADQGHNNHHQQFGGEKTLASSVARGTANRKNTDNPTILMLIVGVWTGLLCATNSRQH